MRPCYTYQLNGTQSYHAARSTQHAARSTQHAARSIQCSAPAHDTISYTSRTFSITGKWPNARRGTSLRHRSGYRAFTAVTPVMPHAASQLAGSGIERVCLERRRRQLVLVRRVCSTYPAAPGTASLPAATAVRVGEARPAKSTFQRLPDELRERGRSESVTEPSSCMPAEGGPLEVAHACWACMYLVIFPRVRFEGCMQREVGEGEGRRCGWIRRGWPRSLGQLMASHTWHDLQL